jgi:flagellar hook protein FlgE
VVIPLGASSAAQASQSASFDGNLDAGGQIATGASVLNSQDLTTADGSGAPTGATLLSNVSSASTPTTALFSPGQVFTLQGTVGGASTPPQTFTVKATSTLSDLMSFYQNSLGIDTTTPPPAGAPTPGVTLLPSGTDPNSVDISISGNVGTANTITLNGSSFSDGIGASPFNFQSGTDANGIVSDPNGESITTNAQLYDSLGNPISVNITAVLSGTSATGTSWNFVAESPDSKDPSLNPIVGTGTLSFNTQGKLVASTGTTINIDRTGTGAKSPLSVKMDFSNVSSLTSTSSDFSMSSQDGSPLGSLNTFSIGSDGTIIGTFSNGLTRNLGQLAVATFNNPEGLTNEGGNLYASGADSGSPVGGAGVEQRRSVDGIRQFDHRLHRLFGRQQGHHHQRSADHRSAAQPVIDRAGGNRPPLKTMRRETSAPATGC